MARFEDPFKEDEETAGFYELLSKLTGEQVERVERRRVKIRSDFFSPPMSANKIGRDEIVLLSLRTLGNISRSFIVSTADTEEDLRGEEGGGESVSDFPIVDTPFIIGSIRLGVVAPRRRRRRRRRRKEGWKKSPRCNIAPFIPDRRKGRTSPDQRNSGVVYYFLLPVSLFFPPWISVRCSAGVKPQ